MIGALIIDKPSGITSHDVVSRARRILREKRIGHIGTLDPFATGVLVLLIGQATRFTQFLIGADKEYQAMVRLGYRTDTGDLTGKVLESSRSNTDALNWTAEEIELALQSLRGEIEQIPPMYSAKKLKGKKLYELARSGVEIEREPIKVNIYRLESIAKEGSLLHPNSDGTCDLYINVECSSGTYIRVLAEELGQRLGVGAHLASLHRTRVGSFKIEDAIGLDLLKESVEDEGIESLKDLLLSPNRVLSNMPFLHLTDVQVQRAQNGATVTINLSGFENGEYVRLLDADAQLIGVGSYDATNRCLHPRVSIAT
jgi:tRNA pseudouridine55 synthase